VAQSSTTCFGSAKPASHDTSTPAATSLRALLCSVSVPVFSHCQLATAVLGQVCHEQLSRRPDGGCLGQKLCKRPPVTGEDFAVQQQRAPSREKGSDPAVSRFRTFIPACKRRSNLSWRLVLPDLILWGLSSQRQQLERVQQQISRPRPGQVPLLYVGHQAWARVP
jgi:hypothetical protein